MDIQSSGDITSPFISGIMDNGSGVEATTAILTEMTMKPAVSDPYRFQTGRKSFEVPFFITVCIFGTLGNLLVIAVYRQKQYFASNAALYILNLAFGDLFLLLGVVSFHVTEYFPSLWWIFWRSDLQCILHRFGRFVGMNITIFTMVAIAIDRYVAVVHALNYKTVCTRKRTQIIIASMWIGSAVTAIPSVLNFATKYKTDFTGENYVGKTPFACRVFYINPFYGDFKIIYISVLLFYVPAIVTMILYIVIVIFVRRNNQKFKKIARSTTAATNSRRSHWKTARVLLVVFVVFAITYGLLTTYTLVQLISPKLVSASVKNWGLLLPYANSCMNPVVYSLINPRFRQALKLMFCKKITQKEHQKDDQKKIRNNDSKLARKETSDNSKDSGNTSDNTDGNWNTASTGLSQTKIVITEHESNVDVKNGCHGDDGSKSSTQDEGIECLKNIDEAAVDARVEDGDRGMENLAFSQDDEENCNVPV